MQTSFFDYSLQYQGGKKSTKFLSEMKELIPFEQIEKLLIEKNIYKPNKGKQGRPSTPVNILVGALFLQSWYGLSDPLTVEYLLENFLILKKTIIFLMRQQFVNLEMHL